MLWELLYIPQSLWLEQGDVYESSLIISTWMKGLPFILNLWLSFAASNKQSPSHMPTLLLVMKKALFLTIFQFLSLASSFPLLFGPSLLSTASVVP